ncbi:methionine ABC transporter permease [Lactococcus paracarnosus]|uniref:ABC transporter permease subunit n=1 Tax=Pseudolactococcus paracarnosus TaxID=2749962 RepID=A0A7L4WBE3_9LACT|nr:ABC transporter permease subunit [Lactococcus paracarnosus]SPC37791.1 ABC transporter permease [Lactococcus piscium]MCJ1977406.1 ABC transporter permease subunit [Lactococcus paracarnosus]MCJ1983466.1 ABC transporter permease subunit [Lactococcus paracarnosus]MCJ1993078.1 ABC transporter permease subunit [Lactococcus paracarnosus]MCJ1998180.1 ABC transporter permease subunit [Lactococcus paracarnosus]
MSFMTSIQYYLPELILALKETGIMMGIAMTSCLLIGLPLGIAMFDANPQIQGKRTIRYWLFNFIVTFVRSFPYLLFVITLIPLTRFLLGRAFGPYPASFSLSLIGIVIFARLVEQVLLDVPVATRELASALGATKWQYIWHFLLAEARSGLVLGYTTAVVSLVSYSTVMGIIGGGGIGSFALIYGYQSYQYGIMGLAIAIMIFLVFIIQMIGNQVAYKLDKRK